MSRDNPVPCLLVSRWSIERCGRPVHSEGCVSVWMTRKAAFCSSYCELGAEPRCLASFQHRLQLGEVWVQHLGCSVEGIYYSEGRSGSRLDSGSCFVHKDHTGSVPQRHVHTTQSLPNTTNKRWRLVSQMFFWEGSWHTQLQGSSNSKEFLTLPSQTGTFWHPFMNSRIHQTPH